MDFLTHFWKLLSQRGTEVFVTIQPTIECFRYPDNSAGRKKLAADCYNRVLGSESAAEDEDDNEGNGATVERLLPS
jgi:hypothetical protein